MRSLLSLSAVYAASAQDLFLAAKESAQKVCDVATMDMQNPSQECLAPVLAEKRSPGEPDSYIPSVYSRTAFSPSTHDVHDLQLGPYKGTGKILVYSTSKYLVEMANGKLFNSGVHTSEILLPMYHFARAGFDKFDFATRDGGAIAFENWTFPMATGTNGGEPYEHKLRDTADRYSQGLNNPMKTEDVAPDLNGYVGIFIPGGHGPLVEFHLDNAMGALLRKAHDMQLPILSLCHGPTVLRAAALDWKGEFPFKDYKTKMFPDAVDVWSPSVGYLPGQLKAEDHAEHQLKELGMQIMNTEMDDSVYQDRELISGASNQGAQKFAELAIQVLLKQ